MIKKEYTRTDGTKGYNHIPEAYDIVVSLMDSPWKSNPITNSKGDTFHNYGIKVKHIDEEFFMKLTKNQYTQLFEQDEIKGLEIEFTAYKKTFDGEEKDLVGVKVNRN